MSFYFPGSWKIADLFKLSGNSQTTAGLISLQPYIQIFSLAFLKTPFIYLYMTPYLFSSPFLLFFSLMISSSIN